MDGAAAEMDLPEKGSCERWYSDNPTFHGRITFENLFYAG
jgi:hypothetical protein